MKNASLNFLIKNKKLILILTGFIFGFSCYANSAYFIKDPRMLRFYPPFVEGVFQQATDHVGAEYYSIANALFQGKGFSNPFEVETGPTAWMPPLYVFLIAGLIKIFHSQMQVGICIVLFTNIVLIVTGVLVYEVSRRTLIKVNPAWSVVFFLLMLLAFFRWFFQLTHDSWLILLCMDIMFLSILWLRQSPIQIKHALAWGISGGLYILTSPIVGLVWLVSSCFYVFTKNKKLFAVSITAFFIICTPWFIRNYTTFGKIVFIKSNLFHDLYYFNYEAPNGLVYEAFEDKCLVWTARYNPDCLYRKIGEAAFMEDCKNKFFAAITNDPFTYLRNIKNRFVAALILWYPHGKHERLSIWICLAHALPFLGMLILLLNKTYRNSPCIQTAFVLFWVYLAPYIIVSYYSRYAVALLPFKVLFIVWGIDQLMTKKSLAKPFLNRT